MKIRVEVKDEAGNVQQYVVRRSLNKLKVIMLFIVLLPLLIMLDMMGMDVFSDD